MEQRKRVRTLTCRVTVCKGRWKVHGIDVRKIFSFGRIVMLVPERMRDVRESDGAEYWNHVRILKLKKAIHPMSPSSVFHGGPGRDGRLIFEKQMLVKILSLRTRLGWQLQRVRARARIKRFPARITARN